ncbi:MAG: heterodisulfide reductase-related iron-sulfur binding cluster [Candidatus Freyarchaeum deiterrae]
MLSNRIQATARMPPSSLVKVLKSDWCCGGGGVRSVFLELADRLATRRIENSLRIRSQRTGY